MGPTAPSARDATREPSSARPNTRYTAGVQPRFSFAWVAFAATRRARGRGRRHGHPTWGRRRRTRCRRDHTGGLRRRWRRHAHHDRRSPRRGDGGDYQAALDPADFVARIDNPLLPFLPGSRWLYESSDGVERIEVEVLSETRDVLGIQATIVRDRVWEDGELVEDTYDWYAQDRDGNVWYLGEDSTEFEDGEPVSTAGSWEAGVDGTQAGVIMWADPTVGQAYRQEYYAGQAEDLAQVLALDGSETLQSGAYNDLVVIREWSPLEPEVIENKYFAPGVGVVLELKVAARGGARRTRELRARPLAEADTGRGSPTGSRAAPTQRSRRGRNRRAAAGSAGRSASAWPAGRPPPRPGRVPPGARARPPRRRRSQSPGS